MPFPSTLDAGQIAQVRETEQAFQQYLLLCPNTVVWQTQPAAQVDGTTPYASFAWDGTDQGDRTNVYAGMTVLISTSSSYATTTIYRGRVRTAPDATTFYINENSTNLETTYYVTVLNDYDVHERLERRTVAGVEYKDWDLTFQTLPPLITGLQSAYVDFSGAATVTWSFAPTVTATAAGASISTYLWDVDDGTITVGSTSTQNITVQFPGASVNEHRWVRLTVTDDNGVSQYFVFEVYTVDRHETSPTNIKLSTDQLSITATLDEGFNATVRAWDGFSSVLNRTRCVVATVDDYGGDADPIVSNVAFVGRLRQDSSPTRGDAVYGVLQEASFTIEGLGTQAGHTNGPGLYLVTSAAAAAWGEITTMTVKRALVYLLAWHSTILNLTSLSFPADSDNYQWPEYVIQEASLLEWVTSVADDINAYWTFAASGESTIQRHASYAGTAGLDTIFNFVVDDGSGNADALSITPELDYIETYAQAIAGAATYNTTNGTSAAYQGRAPAQSFGPGWESGVLNQQIMQHDLSDTDARTEVANRVAAHLAYVNPKARLNVTLMDGFWWLVPTVHQLYTFTIAASQTTRGRAYTTADKWLCVEVGYSHNAEAGTYDVSATFEIVTTGGAAGVLVTPIIDVNDLALPVLPPIGAGADFDPLVNYPVNDPDYTLPGFGSGYTTPGFTGNEVPVGCDQFSVSMRSGASHSTVNLSVFGSPYLVQAEGEAVVIETSGQWYALFDFTQTACGFSASNGGTYSAGSGFSAGPFTTPDPDERRLTATLNFTPDGPVTKMNLTVSDYTGGTWTGATSLWAIAFEDNFGSPLATRAQAVTNDAHVYALTGASLLSGSALTFDARSARDGTNGNVTVSKLELWGTGTAPVEFQTNATQFVESGSSIYGDAFYYNYQDGGVPTLYGGNHGLRVGGSPPSNIPPYSSSHLYVFTTTGTGNTLGFDFEDGDLSDNSNNILQITVCGDNMATVDLS